MKRSTDQNRDYDRARDSFEDLPMEDQALFLFESAVSTVTRGAAHVSSRLARELDDLFRRGARRDSGRSRRHGPSSSERSSSGGASRSHRPGPAEPATGEQRAGTQKSK